MNRKKHTRPKEKKKFKSIDDVKCPICDGDIDEKWFNFRSKNVVEFIAECWTRDDPGKPRHIFYFQIEVPECVLVYDKNSKVFDDG